MLRASLLAIQVVACGPTKGGDDDGTGTTTGGTTQSVMPTGSTAGDPGCDPPHDATDDCCCFSTEPAEEGMNGGDRVLNACITSTLCPTLTIMCDHDDPKCPIYDGFGGGPGEVAVNDEDALACVLTALRDGEPGMVEWTIEWGLITVDRFYIREDRTVLTHRIDADEGGPLHGPVTLEPLAAAGVFEFCLAEPALRDRVACLVSPTAGPVVAMCT